MTEANPEQEQYGSDSPRDTDNLHAEVQAHIKSCEQCTYAVKNTRPRGFGQQSRMCPKYFELISLLTGAPLPPPQAKEPG